MSQIVCRWWHFAAIVAGSLVAPIRASAASGDLHVGAAAVAITPPAGTPMAGYYAERAATGVHDELFAKALVLKAGETRAALVSLDLIGTVRTHVEEARRLIEEATGIPRANIMISATHSHTGPIFARSGERYERFGGTNRLAVEYTEKLPALIAECARQAHERLAPATASAVIGSVDNLAFNRRFFMRDGTVGWNPGKQNRLIVRPAGPTDTTLPVVSFATSDGKPLAIYANFSIHLDTVGGTEFSADAPYTLAKLLSGAIDANLVTLYTTGCCGDINHINVDSAAPQRGHAEAARIGTHLAAGVLRCCERLMPVPAGNLQIRRETVHLPLAAIEPGEIEPAKAVLDRLADPANPPKFLEQVQAFKVLDVADRQGRPLEVEVQAITLGDHLAWVSLPGEVFVELGLAIKQGSPFKQTMIAELANGSIGYIPNRVAYSQENYEVISARCAKGSGELLVETALRLLREMYAEEVDGRR